MDQKVVYAWRKDAVACIVLEGLVANEETGRRVRKFEVSGPSSWRGWVTTIEDNKRKSVEVEVLILTEGAQIPASSLLIRSWPPLDRQPYSLKTEGMRVNSRLMPGDQRFRNLVHGVAALLAPST